MFRHATTNTTKTPHVCIVGAGVAGMRCASQLLARGGGGKVRVTILEARERMGGRFCQGNVGGRRVDLGPNWIHGTHNNPILELARETQTQVMCWDGRQAVVDTDGTHLSVDDAARDTELVWEIVGDGMAASGAAAGKKGSSSVPVGESLYDYFTGEVGKRISSGTGTGPEEKIAAEKRRQRILDMSDMWGAFVGSPVQAQSLRFLWLEECIDGENLFVSGTYERVLERVIEGVKGAEVRLGNRVTRVVSRVDEETGDPVVEVQVEGKEEVEAFDEVVFTAPLGWLKRNLDVFEPELPVRLQQGIEAVGYGHLDKVYITFPHAFWNTSPSSSTSTTPPPQTQAPTQLGSTSSPVNPSHYPGFTSFLRPTYAAATNPSQWNQEAVNLAALPPDTAHPTLLFYTYGPTSQHLASLLKKATATHHDTHDILVSFFAPYISRLPNYDAADPNCTPTATLATQWANDELAGYGAYCNFQVGCERGDEDVEFMRRGCPERGLWFAGEHTAPFVALGTVTGAWMAGEEVAGRVAGVWGL